MTKTEGLKLLKLIEEERIPSSSIGVFLYVYYHAGEVVTVKQMCDNLHVSKNTLITRLRQLHSSKLITKEKAHRGVIFQVTTVKNWATNGVITIYTSTRYEEEAKNTLDDLNKLARRPRPFKLTRSTQELIVARLRSGFTVGDFKQVHRNMRYWLDDDHMSRYYRPQTLYRSDKQFEKYLEEVDMSSSRIKDTTSRWEDEDTKREVEAELEQLAREMED